MASIELGYSLPSLQLMAASQVVVNEWSRSYVIRRHRPVTRDRVPLPRVIENIISDIINPIGVEIIAYQKFWEFELGFDGQFWKRNVHKLCWTSLGTVDYFRTAKVIVHDEDWDVVIRYQIACYCCFKNDIISLYARIPKENRGSLYSVSKFATLWTCIIEGKFDELRKTIQMETGRNLSFSQYGLKIAASTGNLTAAKYFLGQLHSSERNGAVVNISKTLVSENYCLFSKPYRKHVCFLFFSNLTKENWKDIFQSSGNGEFAYELLLCLMQWPYQHLFMKTAMCLYCTLTVEWYVNLIDDIAYICVKGFKYQQLWRELWEQSPVSYKSFMMEKCANESDLLDSLFKMGNMRNINVFLEDATTMQKQNLILSTNGLKVCKDLIENGKRDHLDCFINLCLETETALLQFKQVLKKRTPKRDCPKGRKGRWRDVFRYIDSRILEIKNKRVLEEESNGQSAKRVCKNDSV